MTNQFRKDAYGITNPFQNLSPLPIIAQRAPNVNDKRFPIGTIWTDQTTDQVYSFASVTNNQALWVELTSGGALPEIETLTGNAGGAVSPDAAFNVDVVGSGDISVTGNPGTNTLTISDTSPIDTETLTGDAGGAVGPDVANNISILGGTGVDTVGNPGTNTITINAAQGEASITKYVVDADGSADYTTLQAALTAANTAAIPAMVYVRSGTYTEDLTLFDDIWITGDNENGTIIIGTHTPPTSGNLNFDRLTFQSATDIFNSAAAGTTNIIMEDCTVNVTNGYTFNLLNWTGSIQCFDIGNSGTDDGFLNNTGGATFLAFSAGMGNGTGNTMTLSGASTITQSQIGCPVTVTGTGVLAATGGCDFLNTVTYNAGTFGSIITCFMGSTSGAPLVVNTVNAVQLSDVTIDTSNNPAIDGAGAIDFGSVSFLDEATMAATLTVNRRNVLDTSLTGWNGSIRETTDVNVTAAGGVITLSVEQAGTGNLTVVFSDGYVTWVTAPDTISLTAGSDPSPQINYVYFLQSTRALTVSTVSFPAAEHAPIATVLCQSAASLQTDGAYKVHVWTDHLTQTTQQGHVGDINHWIRHQNARYASGVAQTLTITPNGGAPDNVIFTTAAGVVLQLHDHTFPAFAGTPDIYTINDSVTPYNIVTDLNALLTDSTGGSLTNRRFSLVIWGVVSEDTGDSKLFVNLPSGSYGNNSSLIADSSKFANFTIPAEFTGTGFLISQLNLRHQPAASGTWTSISQVDLRGQFPGVSAGAGAAVSSTFVDNVFQIIDEGDNTKVATFEASGITTATTRTYTFPDESGTIALVGGGGFTWTEVTGVAQPMAVDNGYIANNAGLVTLTLPAVAAVGDSVAVMGKGAGGWRIAQNAGQQIHTTFGSSTVGVGGRMDSTHIRNSIELLCTTANTTWTEKDSSGNIGIT